jgi:hypothetical protein
MHMTISFLPIATFRPPGDGDPSPFNGSFLSTHTAKELHVDRLIELHHQLAHDDGYTDTAVPEVRLTRATQCVAKTPVMSEPCIAIALQGRKRAFFGSDVLQFDADQYLVVAIPMPFQRH